MDIEMYWFSGFLVLLPFLAVLFILENGYLDYLIF